VESTDISPRMEEIHHRVSSSSASTTPLLLSDPAALWPAGRDVRTVSPSGYAASVTSRDESSELVVRRSLLSAQGRRGSHAASLPSV